MNDGKYTADDFIDFDIIDKLCFFEKDKEGYTPLGASILNGAPLKCIAYLMYKYSSYGLDLTKDKSKGKTPLELACMTMNADIISVLLSDHYIYIKKDSEGNPKTKIDHYGDALVIKDSKGSAVLDAEGNEQFYYIKGSVPRSKYEDKYTYQFESDDIDPWTKDKNPANVYKCCVVTEKDILSAAILQKADILKTLLSFYITYTGDLSFTDNSGNTPILLACVAGCYESVDLLLSKDSKVNESVSKMNKSGVNAYMIACQSGDETLKEKIEAYYKLTSAVDAISLRQIEACLSVTTDETLFGDVFVLLLNYVYGNEDIYDHLNDMTYTTLIHKGLDGNPVVFELTKPLVWYIDLAYSKNSYEHAGIAISNISTYFLKRWVTETGKDSPKYVAKLLSLPSDASTTYRIIGNSEEETCYEVLIQLHNTKNPSTGNTMWYVHSNIMNSETNKNKILAAVAQGLIDTSKCNPESGGWFLK